MVDNVPSQQAGKFEVINDISKVWLSSDNPMAQFQNSMCGLVWDANTQEYKTMGEKLINEKGLRSLVSFIQMRSNSVVFLSDTSEEMILKLVCDANKELNRLMLLNEQQWEVQKDYKDFIIKNVMDFIYFSLQRAKEKETQEFIAKTTQSVISQTQTMTTQEANKQGLWDKIFHRGGQAK